MKITKSQLKQIIKEEIHKALSEALTSQFADPHFKELPDPPKRSPFVDGEEESGISDEEIAKPTEDEAYKKMADAKKRLKPLGEWSDEAEQKLQQALRAAGLRTRMQAAVEAGGYSPKDWYIPLDTWKHIEEDWNEKRFSLDDLVLPLGEGQ